MVDNILKHIKQRVHDEIDETYNMTCGVTSQSLHGGYFKKNVYRSEIEELLLCPYHTAATHPAPTPSLCPPG